MFLRLGKLLEIDTEEKTDDDSQLYSQASTQNWRKDGKEQKLSIAREDAADSL